MSGPYLYSQDGKTVLSEGFYEAIGGRIRQARKAREISQKKLKELTNISIERLRILEQNNGRPDGKEILLLCHHLDVTPNWLLYGTDSIKHAKYIQANLVTSHGEVDDTEQLVRMAMIFSVLTPEERRSLEIILTSMLRGSGRSEEEIKSLVRGSTALSYALRNNSALATTINALMENPEFVALIEKAMVNSGED